MSKIQLIIEGSDTLGKTTYANSFTSEAAHKHYTKAGVLSGVNKLAFGSHFMYWMSELGDEEGILDRAHIGSFIWGTMFQFYPCDMTWLQLKALQQFVNANGWQTLVFMACDEVWYRDHIEKVSEERDEENDTDLLLSANRAFALVANKLKLPVAVVGPSGFYAGF